MLILGAHVQINKGFAAAARQTGEEYKCNAMQIFTKNPRGRQFKPLQPQDVDQFKQYTKEYKIKYIIAHSSYLLNFGKSEKEIPWAYEDMNLDFERLHALNGNGVVVHIGKALDGDRKQAIKNVIENAKKMVERTEKTPLEYILENTAGQGTEVGYLFEELAQVWKGLNGFSPRIKFCLDTAHMWGAGYNISTKKTATQVLNEFDQLIGIKNLSCFHFNDSKKECGSKVDRHNNLGNGEIGLPGLTAIAKYAAQKSLPIILETPINNPEDRLYDINLVKKITTDNN